MPTENSDPEILEVTIDQSREVRLARFFLMEKTLNIISWTIIGSVFAYLSIDQLISKYGVPIELLLFFMLGLYLCFRGCKYMAQATLPSKLHTIEDHS